MRCGGWQAHEPEGRGRINSSGLNRSPSGIISPHHIMSCKKLNISPDFLICIKRCVTLFHAQAGPTPSPLPCWSGKIEQEHFDAKSSISCPGLPRSCLDEHCDDRRPDRLTIRRLILSEGQEARPPPISPLLGVAAPHLFSGSSAINLADSLRGPHARHKGRFTNSGKPRLKPPIRLGNIA